jgi:hypothetical protein
MFWRKWEHIGRKWEHMPRERAPKVRVSSHSRLGQPAKQFDSRQSTGPTLPLSLAPWHQIAKRAAN